MNCTLCPSLGCLCFYQLLCWFWIIQIPYKNGLWQKYIKYRVCKRRFSILKHKMGTLRFYTILYSIDIWLDTYRWDSKLSRRVGFKYWSKTLKHKLKFEKKIEIIIIVIEEIYLLGKLVDPDKKSVFFLLIQHFLKHK